MSHKVPTMSHNVPTMNNKVQPLHQRGGGNAWTLPILMLVYGAASLVHFVHNAVYLQQYPNLPSWLTASGIYAAWCGVAAVGGLGYWVYRRLSRFAGLVLIAVYGVLGFAGFDHYAVAPVSAHSIAMNVTILTEAVAAAVLLLQVARSFGTPGTDGSG